MTLLPRSTPAAQGLDPTAVRQLVASLDALHEPDPGPGGPIHRVHSFVLVRNGHVVAEGSWKPHTAERPHVMFSVTKSFTSMAVGLAIEEGLFRLDDRVIDLLAEDAPEQPSANLAAMTVRHLLTMTTGHDPEPPVFGSAEPGGFVRRVLAVPVPYEPGTHFVYNTAGSGLAGAIVQRRSGQGLLDFLRPRLFEPLGITSATWEHDPDGLDFGGYGLSIAVEELAAFGQLCLQRGQWQGRQIVPAAWIDAATAKQVDNSNNALTESPDWRQGYGFQFWRCRHGAYRCDGAFGQFVIVWPEHQIVLAITSGLNDMQSVLNAVWSALLPALTADPGDALAAATGESAASAVDTSGLRLPAPAGSATSPREASVLGVTHVLSENRVQPEDGGAPLPGDGAPPLRAVTLVRDAAGGLLLRTAIGDHEEKIALGYGAWVEGAADLGLGRSDIASAAAWVDESTLVAHILSLGTPFTLVITLRLADDHMEVSLDVNVSFGPTHLLDAVARPAG